MKRGDSANLASSVRQRLLNFARQTKEEYSIVLIRYAAERMLYRLMKSGFRSQFVLKGAMLFNVWKGQLHRPTQDLDFLGRINLSLEGIRDLFKKICTTEVESDGLVFNSKSVRVEEIREDQEYHGVRVRLKTMLGKARIDLQIDIGFGDVVTPPAREVDYPVMLDFSAPRILIYPKETVVAEKLQAIVALDITNSRMKDFFDLWIFQRDFGFDGKTLAQALQATFKRRKTKIPLFPPPAMTEDFAKDPTKVRQWEAFLSRNRLTIDQQKFTCVIEDLNSFLMPPLSALANGHRFSKIWPSGGPWR